MASEQRFVRVASVDEVPPGEMKAVEVDGAQVVLVNSGGEVYALHDSCTHEYFPLSEGTLEGDCVVCLLHGARFKLETGAASAPAFEPVRTYEVRIDGEDVLVAAQE
ncbi:MAG: non-heme iron oxygenase ferredoxin subunit [Gemmatimonadota bacterium]|nr:MAG: non-heme iron oxygenase ferredoxin subunit [Gemmatimonadota bacterium]